MAILLPDNPATLATPFAEMRFLNTDFSVSRQDERDLAQLDRMAQQADMFTDWFVEAGLALITPISFDADKDVTYTKFGDGLSFEGTFACYSRISIGRIIGAGAVRALCMTFSSATLLPYLDPMDQDELLHVPILATNEILPAQI